MSVMEKAAYLKGLAEGLGVDPESKEVYIETAGGIEELVPWQDNLEDLSLTDVRYLPLSDDLSPFTFDTTALDTSWVVTDLR